MTLRPTLRRSVAAAAPLVAWLALTAVPACDGGLNSFADDADGGPDEFRGDCAEEGVDAGPGPDGGALEACEPELGVDQEACPQLVARTCGETCAESPGCAAATLLQTYEPDRCVEALADSQTFPTCVLGNCDTLVAKTCGGDEQCLDAPGCAPALELQTRSADPEATQDDREQAASECLQALEDDVVFAACAQ